MLILVSAEYQLFNIKKTFYYIRLFYYFILNQKHFMILTVDD